MIRNIRNILKLNTRICKQKNQLIQKEKSLYMKQKFRRQLQMQQKIQKIPARAVTCGSQPPTLEHFVVRLFGIYIPAFILLNFGLSVATRPKSHGQGCIGKW